NCLSNSFIGLIIIACSQILISCNQCSSNDAGNKGAIEEIAESTEEVSAEGEGADSTPQKLVMEDLIAGNGATAKAGSQVTVHYEGTLTDGTKFDSSFASGEPFTFELGAGIVIAGWDEGIEGMKVGGRRKLTIPPHLAYGEEGIQ